jgi:hypothetical protein
MSDTERTAPAPEGATPSPSRWDRFLNWAEDHKPVFNKTAGERAHNAFQLGVDVGYGEAAKDLRKIVNGPDRRPSDRFKH